MNYSTYIGAYRDFKEIIDFYAYDMSDDTLYALKTAFQEALINSGYDKEKVTKQNICAVSDSLTAHYVIP